MKPNFWLSVTNIWAKSIGAGIGGMVYFSQFNFGGNGNHMDMAFLAAYCALGYMSGNILSALISLLLLAIDAASNASETLSQKGE